MRHSLILLAALFSSCASQKYFSRPVLRAEKEFHHHIGFVVYDPLQKKNIFEHQADRYFTPASNTKIFTLYAALATLGDSVPSLRYEQRNDSLLFWGTGDPAFLYGNVKSTPVVFDFLQRQPSALYFSPANGASVYLGPGWAWDDHSDYYQVERTPFPVYGNLATVRRTNKGFVATPDVFTFSILDSMPRGQRPALERAFDSNKITFRPGVGGRQTWYVPFHVDNRLMSKLLSDTLKREVGLAWTRPTRESKVLRGTVADSLYKVMMQTSDNFIAEQLMMMVGEAQTDTLSVSAGIRTSLKTILADLPDLAVWVDGSGLSRYNLFTPRTIVKVWEKVYNKVSWDRLRLILPALGESGTLKNTYSTKTSFIIGKSGSLSNHYALSGFLVTKRGRTLIFSWMNNNFAAPTREIRGRMESILKDIYENY
ncbi:MAG TPA: D-alanyl-D-alanine carboxypeptidase [Cyclobacteriaceae bacterium]|nr:D-alanyl-D-alanine carboxypeptidase [Cyclobacteriaceae bacterium]